jgi:hypothetical protein
VDALYVDEQGDQRIAAPARDCDAADIALAKFEPAEDREASDS